MAPFPAKVAVVGSGNVGLTLAKGFRQHGKQDMWHAHRSACRAPPAAGPRATSNCLAANAGAAVFVGTRNPGKWHRAIIPCHKQMPMR